MLVNMSLLTNAIMTAAFISRNGRYITRGRTEPMRYRKVLYLTIMFTVMLVGNVHCQKVSTNPLELRYKSIALGALAKIEVETDPSAALKLALAAWPRRLGAPTPKLDFIMDLIADAATSAERRILRHKMPLLGTKFMLDDTRALTTSIDHTIRIWDVANSREISRSTGLDAIVSPDGSVIAGLADLSTIRTWLVSGDKELMTWQGLRPELSDISSDNKRLLVRVGDNSVRVLEISNGRQLATLRGHSDLVTSAKFSNDGTHVVTGSMASDCHDFNPAGCVPQLGGLIRG